MKTTLRATLARSGALLALGLSALLGSGAATAAGTLAGTQVGNKASLSYSVGTVVQAPIASSPTGSSNGTGATTTFVVDNKINLQITTSESAPISAVPAQTGVTATFVVTNLGNNTQDFALSVGDLAAGSQTIFAANYADNFDTSSCSIRVAGVAQSYIGSLAPDANQTVHVLCSILATRVNSDLAGIRLGAVAATAGTAGATPVTETIGADDPTAVDIVFADGAGSDDSARDGSISVRSAYRVVTAALLVTKQALTVCDPFNGNDDPKSIPNAFVRYTVTVTNSGSTAARLGVITDALETAKVDLDEDLIRGTSAATCATTGNVPQSAVDFAFKVEQTNRPSGFPKFMDHLANADGATFAAGTISVDFDTVLAAQPGYAAGELKAGETVRLIYQVKIK